MMFVNLHLGSFNTIPNDYLDFSQSLEATLMVPQLKNSTSLMGKHGKTTGKLLKFPCFAGR